MPDQPTKLDRAAQIGVAVPVLRNWQRLGVDIFDDNAVRAHLRNVRKMPAGVKPEFMPTADTNQIRDITEIDLDQLKLDLVNAPDRNTAQTIKTQIDGLLNLYKVEAAAGKYVTRQAVENGFTKIGSVVRSAILRLEADMPPMLEGMTAPQMQTAIRSKVDELMSMIADASSQFWREQEDGD